MKAAANAAAHSSSEHLEVSRRLHDTAARLAEAETYMSAGKEAVAFRDAAHRREEALALKVSLFLSLWRGSIDCQLLARPFVLHALSLRRQFTTARERGTARLRGGPLPGKGVSHREVQGEMREEGGRQVHPVGLTVVPAHHELHAARNALVRCVTHQPAPQSAGHSLLRPTTQLTTQLASRQERGGFRMQGLVVGCVLESQMR